MELGATRGTRDASSRSAEGAAAPPTGKGYT